MTLSKEEIEMKKVSMKSVEIKDERDYAIRKGKVLERFNQEFFARFKHNALYNSVYEYLIRDADPYLIIEKLIEINDEQYQKMHDLLMLVPPPPLKTPKPKHNGI